MDLSLGYYMRCAKYIGCLRMLTDTQDEVKKPLTQRVKGLFMQFVSLGNRFLFSRNRLLVNL